MPAYKYEALDAAGKTLSGLLEAENAKAARGQLRGQGLVPLAVEAVVAAAQSAGGISFTRSAPACRWNAR
jgi:general secretion pathway protein F